MILSYLYRALWYPALPIALLATRPGPDGTRERLGTAAPNLDGEKGLRLWAHAASVGEIEAIYNIINRLMREIPDARVVITAMTPAGRDMARRRIPKARAALLAPLDCPPAVSAFIRRVQPHLVLIAETELWPNYFFTARRSGARIAIVNGRISARSLPRYQRLSSLFGAALRCADLVLAQTDADAARFAQLGVEPDKLFVTGNTKFDADASANLPLRRELLAFAHERPIFIAGSTAPGEEEAVVEAYLRLRNDFPALALIVAPRHLARVPEVEKILDDKPLSYVRASAYDPHRGADVMILDTMGELRALYRRAAVAFVGGTLEPGRGGQNPAEPACVSVPVMFGPHHENQRETASALISFGAARVVTSGDEIARVAAKWLGNEEARLAAGKSARECIERLSGGVGASLMHLLPLTNLQ